MDFWCLLSQDTMFGFESIWSQGQKFVIIEIARVNGVAHVDRLKQMYFSLIYFK